MVQLPSLLKMALTVPYKTVTRARHNLKTCARPCGVTTVFQEQWTGKVARLIKVLLWWAPELQPFLSLIMGFPGEFQFLGVHCSNRLTVSL